MAIFQIYVHLHDSCGTHLCTYPNPFFSIQRRGEPSSTCSLPLCPPTPTSTVHSPVLPTAIPMITNAYSIHSSLTIFFLTSFVFCYPLAFSGGRRKKKKGRLCLAGWNKQPRVLHSPLTYVTITFPSCHSRKNITQYS